MFIKFRKLIFNKFDIKFIRYAKADCKTIHDWHFGQ